MKHILFGALFALGSILGAPGSAATLGLTTSDPSVTASSANVDYFGFFDGGLVTDAAITSSSGVMLGGMPSLNFSVGFDLVDPTTFLSGGFGIDDANGQFLSGDLTAIGFTNSVIELQFGNLVGSGVASYGTSVLATISFTDDLGDNPFDALIDLTTYGASITIANVVADTPPIPLPAGAWLLLSGLFGFGWMRRKGQHTA